MNTKQQYCALLGALACISVLLGTLWQPRVHAATHYLAPGGSDSNDGTSATTPWQTFAFAIPQLQPGDTLLLGDGTYNASNSGYPSIICDNYAVNGDSSQPITLKAANERQAFLQGNGSAFPFYMQGCAHWTIEGLHAEQGDFPNSSLESGGVFRVLSSNNVTLRRNLARFNNRYINGAIFELDGSTDSLVEENEIYSYHRHGFSGYHSTNVVFRRNYANSRNYPDISGGYASVDPTAGDSGFAFYPANGNIVENSISENNGGDGGFVVKAVEPLAADDNRFYGNISLHDAYGIGMGPWDGTTSDTGMPHNNLFVDQVIINPLSVGIFSRSAKGTRCDNCTVLASGGAGVNADVRSDSPGDGTASFFGSNILALNNQGTGVLMSTTLADWSIEVANSFNNTPNYSPASDPRFTDTLSIDAELGACKVFIPTNSPLKGAGTNGSGIGANVLFRYEHGALTDQPLWDPLTGQFPCGAIVPGVNDQDGESCFDVHQRLNVDTDGCFLPFD